MTDSPSPILPAKTLARIRATLVPWPRGKKGVHDSMFRQPAPVLRPPLSFADDAGDTDHFTQAAERTRAFLDTN